MISEFVKISTTAWEGRISSVVYVSEKDEIDEDSVFEYIREEKIDSVAIYGDEPMKYSETVSLAKRFKKSGTDVKISTGGEFPDRLDDIIGACYVDAVRMNIASPEITDEMSRSIGVIFDSGIEHEFRIVLDKKKIPFESVNGICRSVKGAKHLSLIVPKGSKGFTKSEISEIGSIARKYAKDVKMFSE